jgi:coenzyme PQQ precursor peptide PqqA
MSSAIAYNADTGRRRHTPRIAAEKPMSLIGCMTEVKMAWKAPKIVEVSCAMEVTRYAPADGTEPVLF